MIMKQLLLFFQKKSTTTYMLYVGKNMQSFSAIYYLHVY